MTGITEVWGGWYRDCSETKMVITVDGIAGKTECGDCSGTGLFDMPDDTPTQCVCCRGTGYQWVSI